MSGRYRDARAYPAYDDRRYTDPPGYREYDEYPDRTSRRHVSATRLRRSHAAIPVAVAVLIAGLVLGTYSVLVPALLGLIMIYTALAFLSSRLNPFSIGFYLTVKPSWTAIGVLVLLGFLLIVASYLYYTTGFGPIAPGFRHLP